MRTLPTLACISMVSLLAACTQSDGYYDANGNYQYRNTASSEPFEHDVTLRDHMRNDSRAQAYERRGYYDSNRNYIDYDQEGLNVPSDMFPPRGMCRVWFTNRNLADQPPIKRCGDIRTRVPAGAYMIYGG